jgi:ABC-type multidrug transport system fused ATPase/permease subunit
VLTLDLDGWRRRLAVAPQVPFLFSETVAQNIAMGAEDPVGVRDVLERAALSGDLKSLPNGMDTLVGERGVMLSGGQRQRVALARALYRDFDLLVLDDVLSAVDHGTEQRLIAALATVGQGKHRPTVLLVSNRTSALVHADTILVLDNGRLVVQATHAELIKRPGPYQEAWLYQSMDQSEPAVQAP